MWSDDRKGGRRYGFLTMSPSSQLFYIAYNQMKNTLSLVILLILLLFFFNISSNAQLYSLETENLRLIYYDPLQSYLVPHVVRCFENSNRFHHDLWDYSSPEKITVLLYDLSDYGNAGARNVPKNLIPVAIAPFSYAYETVPANERINTVMNHEMVHVVAMDKATGSDRFFRKLFLGKPVPDADNPLTIFYDYLSTPRRSAPRWYHEGIAVFLETWMAGGYGRALGAYDEMVFRTMVRDSARFYDPVGLEAEGTKIDFHVGVNSYLYGTRFFSYLAYRYKPENLIEWVSRKDGSNGYFITQFKNVYGAPLGKIWEEWIEWENTFQKANIDSIRTYPTTPYREISKDALGSISRVFYDSTEGKLYAAVNYPGQVPHIASINLSDGRVEKLCDVKGAALFFVSSTAYDQATGSLFYTTDNYAWRDLEVYNIHTGKTRVLLKDARIGDLVFNRSDSSLWGVRHFNGISTLVRIPYPYDKWKKIYSWPYGKDIYDIDMSKDGKLLSGALVEISGRQALIVMDIDKLSKGDSTYTPVFDFKNSNPAGFVFSDDNRYLYGSSYYTGVSNIFRYDFQRDSMEALSNCETGFFRPILYGDDSLVVFRYTGKGFKPVVIPHEIIEDVSPISYLGQQIVEKHPVVKNMNVGSPADINIDSLVVDSGSYKAFSHIQFNSMYPVVTGYKNHVAAGFRFNFSDPIVMHRTNLTLSYIPNDNLGNDEKWHVDGSHSYLNWHLNFSYNHTDFYDMFGPTKTSFKGYSAGLQYNKTLIYDEPKTMDYTVSITGYGDLERVPNYQNVSSSFDKLLNFSFKLNYQNMRASLGAVDYEKGLTWQFVSSNNYVNKKTYPHLVANFDFGIPLPIHHSSVWLRTSTGYSHGDREEPFANFYFGGFGNNWVDHLPVQRYREYYAFPGMEINEVGGTNFLKVILDWNLPPLRFSGLGFPALYCSWARMALFLAGIVTNMDSDEWRRELVTVGSQVDFRMQLLSHLRLTFSVGYAFAFEEDKKTSEEFMLSLKIL